MNRALPVLVLGLTLFSTAQVLAQVTIYSGSSYRGTSQTLYDDIPDLRRSAVGSDQASSLRIQCGKGISWNGDPAPDRIVVGLELYDDGDFRGTREIFRGDVPEMDRTRIGNDRASSVRVAPGCRVRLYDGSDYGGRYAELSGAESSLGRTRVGNDRVSSLEIRCAGDRRPWNTNQGSSGGSSGGSHDWGDWNEWDTDQQGGVVLFEDRDFRGSSTVVNRNMQDLQRTSVGEYAASSIRVPSGCSVDLYSGPDYRGNRLHLDRSEHYLGDTRIGNDAVASIKVNCRNYSGSGRHDDFDDWHEGGRWGVTLYADARFRGTSDTLDHDSRNMRDTRVGDDRVSSVRVPHGCRVTLYADPSYRGSYTVLHDDVEDMSDTRVGNDRVSSVRVDCH